MPYHISAMDVRKFLESDGPPLEDFEFAMFWAACTESEKAQYKDQVGALIGTTQDKVNRLVFFN